VITRFGTGSMAGFIGGSLGSIDGWFPVGTTAISPFGSTQVTLAADGTLTFSRVLPIDSPSTTFVFTFQYEVQNVWGTTAATVRIERGVSGTSVTTSRLSPVQSSLTRKP